MRALFAVIIAINSLLRRAGAVSAETVIFVCRGYETVTGITPYDRSNCDQEEQKPEGAEAVPEVGRNSWMPTG